MTPPTQGITEPDTRLSIGARHRRGKRDTVLLTISATAASGVLKVAIWSRR
jgi:hypothetical protein